MSNQQGQRNAHRAYEFFLARGGAQGHHAEDSLAAEAELTKAAAVQ